MSSPASIVRATRDLDVFVSADESNIARLRAALREVFADPEIEGISAADLAGDSVRAAGVGLLD